MTPRERFALRLLDALWRDYRSRVPYARVYEDVLAQAGGRFANDHVAFRTFALQAEDGLFQVARPFEALGWVGETAYRFPDKGLSALHLRHPDASFPKVFVSELRVWELPAPARARIRRSVRPRIAGLSDAELAALAAPGGPPARMLARLLRHFDRPWPAPKASDVLALDRVSQYAAWTLLFGYRVNHFTASINAHGVAALAGIERTVAALREAGVPMKAEIEGARGSKLRQSATAAAEADAEVRGPKRRLRWPYAYFELAERSGGFEGFLGGQAAQLFEMTRRG
ncbi:MAG: DUF1338 domain-containing protein [Elusimicrobia bacterium]|nr:DUF1338 domain-containing protein [Elusimicrobiota bacterium]